MFFCEFCEIYKKTFFTDYLQWLLLIVPNWFMKINPLLAACYRLFQMHLQVNWLKFTLDSGKDSSEIQLLRKYISFPEVFRKIRKTVKKTIVVKFAFNNVGWIPPNFLIVNSPTKVFIGNSDIFRTSITYIDKGFYKMVFGKGFIISPRKPSKVNNNATNIMVVFKILDTGDKLNVYKSSEYVLISFQCLFYVQLMPSV